MRRIALIVSLAALAVCGTAAGARLLASGLGTLAVQGGDGQLVVQGSGVVYGYLQKGSLLVFSYKPSASGPALSVEGAVGQQLPGGLTAYSGSGVRFLLPDGSYIVEFIGSSIDVSAVGSGEILESSGAGSASDGLVTLNGARTVAFDHLAPNASFGSGLAPSGAGATTTTTTTTTATTTTPTATVG
jgi:hypothetical protein